MKTCLEFRFGLVAALTVAVCAGCSRVGSSQKITESEQYRRLEEQVRRCATDSEEKAPEACRGAVRLGVVDSGMAFPNSPLFYERIATALLGEQQHMAALYTYREGVSRYPENARLHYRLGALLVEQYGAYEEAYGPLLEAVRWDQRSKEALTLLGDVQRRLRRYDESIGSFEGALRVDVDHVDALIGLGHTLRSQGRVLDAIPVLSRAVELAPENGFAQQHLGGALLDADRPAEAVAPLQRAVKLLYDPRDAYCMLSASLAKIGRNEEGRLACELAKKPRPSHRDEPVCACQ